jgi:hypothetical protein
MVNTPPQLVGGVENVIMQSLAPACGAVAALVTVIVSVPSFVTAGLSSAPVSKSSNTSGGIVAVMVGVFVGDMNCVLVGVKVVVRVEVGVIEKV